MQYKEGYYWVKEKLYGGALSNWTIAWKFDDNDTTMPFTKHLWEIMGSDIYVRQDSLEIGPYLGKEPSEKELTMQG
jgi:hypothetical protein